jgi:2-polyprenyl-3-methyl-5-hydroxy-6-metoxy-1,4-benzoquinol methylase
MNEDRLMGLVNQAVGDFGSILTGGLVVLGDRLGLYRTLATAGGPLTSDELAAKAGCAERYVREWLNGQAASGYVTYVGDGRYTLDEEQAIAFTDESSPACVIGGFQAMLAATRAVDKLTENFRSGEGLGWDQHHHDLFHGTERFFRPGYIANLTSAWIPALTGAEEKLNRGATVADIGCGHGASTIIMAQAYPASTFIGFDYHQESVEAARKAAADAGVSDRVKFEVASAKDYPGTGYDLVAIFDALHDMGDPAGVAAVTRAGRQLAHRRAVRQRQRRGQPDASRPGLLLRVDADLHAGIARARGWHGAGRAGRRGTAAAGRRSGRLHPVPPGSGDTVQPRARGAALGAGAKRAQGG